MAFNWSGHHKNPLSPENERIYQDFVKTGRHPFKPGDVIINPFYSDKLIDAWKKRGREKEVDDYEMLCVIEKIFKHKHRDRGVGFRLVSIHNRRYIINTSLKDILAYQ